jgi:Family of unknown function (DUF6498)
VAGANLAALGSAAMLALSYCVSFCINCIGGFATMALGEPIWLIAIMVVVKIAVDLRMHFSEHLKLAGDSEIEQVAAD